MTWKCIKLFIRPSQRLLPGEACSFILNPTPSICWINSSHLSAQHFSCQPGPTLCSFLFSFAAFLSSTLQNLPNSSRYPCSTAAPHHCAFGGIFQTSLPPSHLHIFLPQVCPRCCPSRSPRRPRSPRCGWSPCWRTCSSTQHHQQPQATADTGPSRGGELDLQSF